MAQLVTTKEKYGVSVAARIDPELAHQISDRAEKLGISFAKMVSMLISRGFNPQEPIHIQDTEEVERLTDEVLRLIDDLRDLQEEIDEQAEVYKTTAAEFINRVAGDDNEKIQFIEIYNQVLNEQRGNEHDTKHS